MQLDQPWTCYVAKDEFELVILLPLSPSADITGVCHHATTTDSPKYYQQALILRGNVRLPPTQGR